MTTSETPEELLMALERAIVEGRPLPRRAGGLRCDARFTPRPYIRTRGSYQSPDEAAPLVEAALDFESPHTLYRRPPEGAPFALESLAGRFVVERRGDAERWYGFITLGAANAVELPTPEGVELVPEARWAARTRSPDVDLVIGADLLRRGALVYVGAECGLLDTIDHEHGAEGVVCFFVPRYAPVRLRPRPLEE